MREAIDNAQDEKVKETLQEEYNKEAAKLTKYNAQYVKFCKDNNLKKLNDRISVAKWNRSEDAKSREIVANYKISVIIKAKKLDIYDKILSGELPLKINVGNQNKHITTSHSFKPENKKSYIYGDLETAQNLVKRYFGKGELKFNKKGEWCNKEFVTPDEDIGVTFDLETGEEQATNRFAIHYGKKGTHIVPTKRKE